MKDYPNEAARKMKLEAINNLYLWVHEYDYSRWHDKLFDLIEGATPENRHKCWQGFEQYFKLWKYWKELQDKDQIFKRYKIGKFAENESLFEQIKEQ